MKRTDWSRRRGCLLELGRYIIVERNWRLGVGGGGRKEEEGKESRKLWRLTRQPTTSSFVTCSGSPLRSFLRVTDLAYSNWCILREYLFGNCRVPSLGCVSTCASQLNLIITNLTQTTLYIS